MLSFSLSKRQFNRREIAPDSERQPDRLEVDGFLSLAVPADPHCFLDSDAPSVDHLQRWLADRFPIDPEVQFALPSVKTLWASTDRNSGELTDIRSEGLRSLQSMFGDLRDPYKSSDCVELTCVHFYVFAEDYDLREKTHLKTNPSWASGPVFNTVFLPKLLIHAMREGPITEPIDQNSAHRVAYGVNGDRFSVGVLDMLEADGVVQAIETVKGKRKRPVYLWTIQDEFKGDDVPGLLERHVSNVLGDGKIFSYASSDHLVDKDGFSCDLGIFLLLQNKGLLRERKVKGRNSSLPKGTLWQLEEDYVPTH